jgi:hypothetical protein
MATLDQIMGFVNQAVPNGLDSTTKISLVNDEIRYYWDKLTSTNYDNSLVTIADQAVYNLPSTSLSVNNIVHDGVAVATSTNAITSTMVWQTYSFCSNDDELSGYQYYESLGGTFGIWPIPTTDNDGRVISIRYQEYPTIFESSDVGTTNTLNIHDDYLQAIKYKVCNRVAKMGNNPRVQLGNNYLGDALIVEKNIKNRAKTKHKRQTGNQISYKRWW